MRYLTVECNEVDGRGGGVHFTRSSDSGSSTSILTETSAFAKCFPPENNHSWETSWNRVSTFAGLLAAVIPAARARLGHTMVQNECIPKLTWRPIPKCITKFFSLHTCGGWN